ncbi:MAG TPA: pyridoxal phosphate-dependent aminotransferase [Pyrinomonadaceae bacterium]|nr:pyridoxal phosphate-dependent aminotransferase [Chloracidobacterium sp.]MBP9934897.1 pyridoxal phosphate-dependent aminotransferase [Pyrinomonadaceae bacterium]MBK7803325.1 pyridoxal phosphate-dependent aminotransferase [Chloracidobacterium sp.]MBK9438575.1 pyridoxal phosphate-dependent aminotransferase [Chloracidobacterium sp.]MBK9766622.1 pyridoxal phosphate-dependent aminotransferase [Chloracidobacterium sp.]
MTEPKRIKVKPDIRAITRLVPPSGNLVQGQSELPIDPQLAAEAASIIAASQNHYGGSEGDAGLRKAVAAKIAKYNGIEVDVDARPFEVMITNGGTGALIGIAQSYLRGNSALVFEPYYPYHRRILEDFGSKTETFELDENLSFQKDALMARCKQLKDRTAFPLKVIIVCSPANPSGKVMSPAELEAIADVAKELDLLVVSDEVYEHYVLGENPHIPIASLPGMWERTITVNSFSKSWNISGWRLGYAYGKGELIAPINAVANVIYVCPVTPLQAALSRVLMADAGYYPALRDKFDGKRRFTSEVLTDLGFEIYNSGSCFYIWARIPRQFNDAIAFNEMLMRDAGVGMTPGSAFADNDVWDAHVRICIAREDTILEGAMEKLRGVLA